MDPWFYVIDGIWLLIFLAVAYFAARKWWLYIFVVKTETTCTGSAMRGTEELVGKVEPTQIFTAPFSKKECVYYRYDVKCWESDGDSSSWRTVGRGSSTAPFLLDDGTGEIKIDPKGAKMHLNQDGIWAPESMKIKEVVKILKEYDARAGQSELPLFLPTTKNGNRLGGKKVLGIHIGGELVKCEEYCIESGDELYVLGTVNHERTLAKGKGHFIISDQGEMTVTRKTLVHAFFLSVALFILLAVGALFVLIQM